MGNIRRMMNRDASRLSSLDDGMVEQVMLHVPGRTSCLVWITWGTDDPSAEAPAGIGVQQMRETSNCWIHRKYFAEFIHGSKITRFPNTTQETTYNIKYAIPDDEAGFNLEVAEPSETARAERRVTLR